MDGSMGNTGVALISGSGIFAGDSITLLSGAREWRIRIPSARESANNVLYIEYKSGARWIEAETFIVPNQIIS